jgi:hypothetical protein
MIPGKCSQILTLYPPTPLDAAPGFGQVELEVQDGQMWGLKRDRSYNILIFYACSQEESGLRWDEIYQRPTFNHGLIGCGVVFGEVGLGWCFLGWPGLPFPGFLS